MQTITTGAAIDLYRAILQAAAVAPAAGAAQAAAQENDDILAELGKRPYYFYAESTGVKNIDSAPAWMQEMEMARSEIMDIFDSGAAPEFIRFRHGKTMLKIRNHAERLQKFAADMLKSWSLWGGGEKPATEQKRQRSQWPAAKIRAYKCAIEDGDMVGALALAQELGGKAVANGKGAATMCVAPDAFDFYGIPDLVSAMHEDGKFAVIHWPSGTPVIANVDLLPRSRAKAEEMARTSLLRVDAEVISGYLSAEPVAGCAIDAWCAQHCIAQDAAHAPEPEAMPEAAPALDQQAPVATEKVAPPVPAENQGGEDTPARSIFKTEEGATMPAITPQDFAQDVPLSLAIDAHKGTSFSPEKRGQSARDGYAHDMAQALAELTQHATKGGTLDKLPEVFAQYRERQGRAYRAYLASSSRIVSTMIAGRSNFPAARMNKRADIAHKRLVEYLDGGKAAMRRAITALRPDLRPIMAGDADAVERLQREIDSAERSQSMMKSANAAIRKHAKAGHAHQVAALIETGFSERQAIEALKPDYAGRIGFPSYALSNNSANIRRMKERLEKISKAKAQEMTEHDGRDGVRIEDDAPANRVRLFFPGKPSEDVRDELKANGFRWAPSIGAWQAYRNDRTMRLARGYLLPTAPAAQNETEATTEPAAPDFSAPDAVEISPVAETATAPAPVAEVGGVEGGARSNLDFQPQPETQEEFLARAAREIDSLPDVLALSVTDAQAMPESVYAQHLDIMEDWNHHTERLMLECLRAGQWVLAQAVAHLVRYQRGPDYQGMGGAYFEARAFVSHKLKGWPYEPTMQEARDLLASWGLWETPAPHKAPASPEFAALMAQAREARHLAREAIERAKESSRTATPDFSDPARAFPHLLPLTKEERHKGGTGAAPNIRRHLKSQFPGVKFSVVSNYSRVRVRWTDGPTAEDVDAALSGFDVGHSDYMTDYFYTEQTEFSEIFGGVQYLFTSREISDDLLARSLLAVFGPNGPSVADFRACKAWSQVQQGKYKGCQMSQCEWIGLAESHARKI